MTEDARGYWIAFIRRRWPLMGVIFGLVVIAAGVLAARSIRNRPYVSSAQLFVAAKPAHQQQVAAGGPFLSLEAEGRFMAVDIAAVISSRSFATAASGSLPPFVAASGDAVAGEISSSATGRVVTISVADSSTVRANLIATEALRLIKLHLGRYLGKSEAARTEVSVLARPKADRASSGHYLLIFMLRAIVGAVVALALALTWDYFDTRIRDEDGLEAALNAPILTTGYLS